MNSFGTFSNGDLSGEILLDGEIFTVRGQVLAGGNQRLRYWAASPVERRQSLVGSGLPFATEAQAMESSPNQGSLQITDGNFEFSVRVPNAYYACQGNTLVPPQVHVLLEPLNRQYILSLGPVVPNRSLSSLPGRPDRSTYR
jgi:hypothetical protein